MITKEQVLEFLMANPGVLAEIETELHETVFSLDQFPPRDEEEAGLEVSDTVLIDLDGQRTNMSYVLGFYNYSHQEWVSKDENMRIDPKSLSLWRLLPLAKYK